MQLSEFDFIVLKKTPILQQLRLYTCYAGHVTNEYRTRPVILILVKCCIHWSWQNILVTRVLCIYVPYGDAKSFLKTKAHLENGI